MKRLLPLFCILVILFASAGVASADKPLPDSFTITGYTLLPFSYDTLPSGRTKFDLVARGGGNDASYDTNCNTVSAVLGLWSPSDPNSSPLSCQQLCSLMEQPACGLTDRFAGGAFKFEEKGNVDYSYATGEGSGKGTNQGDLTITMPDPEGAEGGKIIIRFDGKTDGVLVSGNWRVLSSSGTLDGLQGQGEYAGNAGLVFSVTFDGKFH
jgi:hypothetical protein